MDEGIFGESPVGLENNGVAEAPLSDTINLENLGVDGGTQGASIEFPRSFIRHDPIAQQDFAPFRKASKALAVIKDKNDEDLLKGGIHNALAALDASLDGMAYDEAILAFFGKDVSPLDAAGKIGDIYSLLSSTDQYELRDFLALSPEKQSEAVMEYAQKHSANKPKIAKRSAPYGSFGGISTEFVDNPKYDPEKAKEEYLQSLREKDLFSAFQYCRQRFPRETIMDAMEFIRADNWRSDLANAYVAKFSSMDPERARDVVSAISILSPKSVAGFFERVRVQLGERATDTWTNIKEWVSASDYSVNPDTVYSWARDFGAFDENGNQNAENFARLRRKVEEYGMSSFGIAALNEEYSDVQISEMYREGRRRFEQRKLFRELRSLAATQYDYSNVDPASKLLEDTLITGAEMFKYLGVGVAATAATGGNAYAGAAASMGLIYMEEASRMYDSLVYDGEMPAEKAAYFSTLYGGTAAALEQFQITRFSKALRGTSYLLKGDVAQKSFKGYLAHAAKEYPKTYLREGGAETFTEYAQGLADYATKAWVADHENAAFDEIELWNAYKEDFLETSKVMPTLMFFATGLGFGRHVNRIRRQSGASIKGIFTPSDAVNNQVRAQAAFAQLDARDIELKARTESIGGKYGEDFVAQYAQADAKTRERLLGENFKDAAARNAFTSDFASFEEAQLARDKLSEVAARNMARLQAQARRRHEEEAAELEREFQKIEPEAAGMGNMSLVESFLERYGGREDVVFVENASDLPLTQAANAEQILSDSRRTGFYEDGSGKIYLINSHFKDGVDALRTLVHERLHWVASKIRKDPGFDGMLARTLTIMGGGDAIRAELPGEYSGVKDNAIAEEYLARVCERVALKQALNERQKGVFRTFKNWISRIFTGENTYADIADREIAEIAKALFNRANAVSGPRASGEWSAKTPEEDGASVGGRYTLIDAASLITSTDNGYDDTLQPRNRTRRGSVEQISKIATNLDPLRLDYSTTTDDGAPIVDAKGQVISGDGRVLAIRQAYRDNPERALNYKNYVLSRAREMGLNADSGMASPVLVRRVDDLGGMSLQEFAARSNKQKVASMSNAETAVADARRISEINSDGGRILDLFFPSDSGDVLAQSNTDFINAFFEAVGGREQYIDAKGGVKPNLAPRIRAAVLAAMLGTERREVVENLLDNPEGWSGLVRGLIGSAANLGKLVGNPDYDLSGELSQAVELYMGLRREGRTLAEYLSQSEMFEEPPSNEVGFLVQLFEANAKTPSGISGVLNEYYSLVKNIDTTSGDLFGEDNPSKFEELQKAFGRYASASPESGNAKWKIDSQPSPEEIAEAERQLAEVDAKYRDSPQWMKAPNGKPTKLTEKQWLQVRTPNFKKWFGDWENDPQNASKVVDENGEPLVVYHGSGSIFYEFKGEFTGKGNDQYGSGFYFTSLEETAKGYTSRRISDGVEKPGGEDSPNVVAGFLSLKNPIIIPDGREIPNLGNIIVDAKQAYEIIKRAPRIMDNENSILGDFFESYWSDGASDSLVKKLAKMNQWDLMTLENDVFRGEPTAFRKSANEALGFDGVQINFTNGEKHFVSWFPTQIKSAADNAGTFSDSPDIRWRIDEGDAQRINAELENLNMGVSDAERAEIESRIKAITLEWASNLENLAAAASAYIEAYTNEDTGQITLDPDEARHFVPGFNPSMTGVFIEAGNKVSSAAYNMAYDSAPNKSILFLSGNPGSGKSFARSKGLIKGIEEAGIILDSPLNNYSSVRDNTETALKEGFKVSIVQIYNSADKSFINTIERGIKTGRFVPWEYFKKAYESAQGKVAKIEAELAPKGVEAIYIDNAGDIPKAVNTEEAKAWEYSIDVNQLTKILRYIYENQARIRESANQRGDKVDPLAIISRGLQDSIAGHLSESTEIRGFLAEIESGIRETERNQRQAGFGLGDASGPNASSEVRNLIRQERGNNPLVWASIVLAKDILQGRTITQAKLERLLPPGEFDGSNYEYVKDRAGKIAETCRAKKYNLERDLDQGVQMAESDFYWQSEYVDRIYESFRKDGEAYGEARQKVLRWLREMKQRKLDAIKGYEAGDFNADLVDSILRALENEPERPKSEDMDARDIEDAEAEFYGDDGEPAELSGGRPLLNEDIRGVISSIRREVIRRSRAADDTESVMREKYRKTLVNVLADAAGKLTYGRERELIMRKIGELSRKAYAAIRIKDGERAGQKLDNFTLRAEHIALRIFNRSVRDDKKALTEKLHAALKRHGKKPSRMERDDKRNMAGSVQKRINAIKGYVELDADGCAEAFAAASEKLENAEKYFEKDPDRDSPERKSDMEDLRAEVGNAIADLKMFGNWAEKSRGEMAQAVDFLENYIDSQMSEQARRIEERKAENAAKRKVLADALRASTHNASRDGSARRYLRKLATGSMPFDSLLDVLAEYATGETRERFEELRNGLVSRIHRAADGVSNEVFRKQERLYEALREIYSTSAEAAMKRLLTPDGKLERFSNSEMPQEMSIAQVMQLYASAAQQNYAETVFRHRAAKSDETVKRAEELERQIKDMNLSGLDEYEKGMLKQSRAVLERELSSLKAEATRAYIAELEKALSPEDMRFIEWLRKEYREDLPAISRVSKRVIGLGIESEDPLYMPVKVERSGGMEEGAPSVPVVPKSLSPRVAHSRDFDETGDVLGLFFDRVATNAQFKAFSEIYLELRALFGDAEIQTLIRERCGADVLQLLKGFIADIASGKTRGFAHEEVRKASGIFAIMQLGFNLGSGVRQFLPGVFSWGTYIGTADVLKNFSTFFTPEGFAAAMEIFRSETARRRFASGNMQIIEELLAKPDQNRFWRLYKRYALVANRASDMLAIAMVGQGVYRTGIEAYLRRGFSAEKARELAMSDMWQIAERTQASGKIMNMSHWQRRGGDLAKAIGMFSSPPQLMFSKSVSEIRRAIALGVKTPEGRAAVWKALRTWAVVSMLVEGSYAASMVLWNALLKGGFDDDDEKFVLTQMATGPFGGLFLFGRMVDSVGSGYSSGIMPMEGLVRPMKYTWELSKDLVLFDWEEVPEDVDKLGASVFAPWREWRKIRKAREN